MDNQDLRPDADNNLEVETQAVEEEELVIELSEVDLLKQQLEQLQQESTGNYNHYMRTLAEMENLRKRATREKEEYIKYATLPMIKKLLPVIDDLDRALAMSGGHQDYDSLSKGVEMICRSLHELVRSEGVEAIQAKGQPFDPQFHEPLILEASDEHPDNTVIEELQKGYIMHGRILRPSLVKVSNSGS